MTASGSSLFARNDELREVLRRAASALKAHGPEFALAGSYALWVYGAPEPVHDVDFVVAEADVDVAATTLEDAGFTVTRTPEDWLFKAKTDGCDDSVIDVLHRLNGVPVNADLIRSNEVVEVLAIRMPVLAPTQVMIQKLRSLHEHYCDFARLLPAVRATRERVDWERVRASTADNDFAVAFLVLVDRLGITS
ncbi:MAG: nucleotidyltransferase [Mycobacterium sp.]|nr:nucleotidyltransferase [Mycobacterium sp.]MBV9721668.1 nucleotidyltransferase [Mycobacterium sp.]